jgi:hypothetical protein
MLQNEQVSGLTGQSAQTSRIGIGKPVRRCGKALELASNTPDKPGTEDRPQFVAILML